ncbi:MAG: DUF4340 domain-containing protein [bacterium]
MKFKKTLVLFITLVFLVLLAYLLERPKGTVQPSSLFPEFTIDAASLIDVRNKDAAKDGKEEAVSLAKEGQEWKIAGFPADEELVKKALESIAELKKAANVVSKNPENQKLYEVDPNKGIKVKISDGKKKVLADFFVGKTGPDFMSTYLRKADSNEVLLCEGYHLRSAFSRTLKNWYDLNVSKFTPEDISKIEIVEADRKISLKKDKDKWQLTDPNQQQAQAKKNLADDMANTLSRLRAIDLLKAEPDKFAEYNLTPPARQVSVFLADGTERKISIGKKNEQNQYYVKAEKDVVYLVAQYHIDKLSKSFEELKEVPPPPAQADPNSGGQAGANALPAGENPADLGGKSQAGTPQGPSALKMPPSMPVTPPAVPKAPPKGE